MSGLKAVIGEYGKVIILALVLCVVVLFLFGKEQAGFLGMLKQAKPTESVGNQSAFPMAKAIAERTPPQLSVTVKKLERYGSYNLLDKEGFQIEAVNEDGEMAEVSVIKIVGPGGTELTERADPLSFIPDRRGEYHITYQAKESYLGSIKKTEKVYCFVAD